MENKTKRNEQWDLRYWQRFSAIGLGILTAHLAFPTPLVATNEQYVLAAIIFGMAVYLHLTSAYREAQIATALIARFTLGVIVYFFISAVWH